MSNYSSIFPLTLLLLFLKSIVNSKPTPPNNLIITIIGIMAIIIIGIFTFSYTISKQRENARLQSAKNYIAQGISRGYSRESLIKKLRQTGYSEREIDRIMRR